MASKGILKNSGSSRMPAQGAGKPPAAPTSAPTVVFGRRTDSGRFISYSRDDLDSEISSVDFQDYHVHIPMTPDNQPMEDEDGAAAARAEECYVSGSLFTGGFNSVTRAHVMDKQDGAGAGRRGGAKGAGACMVEGCDARAMRDARGDVVLPCECDFRICVDCFTDAVKAGGAACPGCKEPYKNTEWEDLAGGAEVTRALSLPRGPAGANGHKMERRLSLVKQTNVNQSGEFDHNRWLFETKGTYGYGNALWPKDGHAGGGGTGFSGFEEPPNFGSRCRRPLTRKTSVSQAILSPYRYKNSPIQKISPFFAEISTIFGQSFLNFISPIFPKLFLLAVLGDFCISMMYLSLCSGTGCSL